MIIRNELFKPVVRVQIVAYPGGGTGTLTAAQVLGEFDVLRRAVAIELASGPGVFAGYDRLEMPLSAPPAAEFCMVAEVVRQHSRGWHQVQYRCHAVLRGSGATDHLLPVLLADGLGTTLVP